MASSLGGGMRCIKYMLFITNLMFVMIGALLISVGATVREVYHEFDAFVDSSHFSPSALTIAVGVLMFAVSFLGCAGAIRESVCIINIYGVMLCFVLVLEMATAIVAFAVQEGISDQVDSTLWRIQQSYYGNENSRIEMDLLQSKLACCGYKSYLDYVGEIPSSCYEEGDLFERGCIRPLRFIIRELALMLASGALAVSFIQMLGVVFSFMLARTVRKLKTQRDMQRWVTRPEEDMYSQMAADYGKHSVLYTVPESTA